LSLDVLYSEILECDDQHPCQGLGEHAHFRSFGMAFLTLFRIATGDNWNGIMKVRVSAISQNYIFKTFYNLRIP